MMQLLSLKNKHWQWQQRSDCPLNGKHRTESMCTLDDGEESCTCMEGSHTTISYSLDESNYHSSGRKSNLKSPVHSCRRRSSLSVSFGEVHVREFPVCLGDNPSVTNGVPVTIQWDCSSENSYSVDLYDRTMAQKCNGKAETIPAVQRFCMLRKSGVSQRCIMEAERDAALCKRGRALTMERMHMDAFEGALEAMAKGALNATFNRRKKKEQRKILDQFRENDQANLTVLSTSSSCDNCHSCEVGSGSKVVIDA